MNRTARMENSSTAAKAVWSSSGIDGLKTAVQEILSPAGIVIDGDKPWDIRIRDYRFYSRVLIDGSLGLGESYMDGWWDCDRLDEFFSGFYRPIPKKS